MLKLAHIINPVRVDESSDLYVAQPVTFETMRAARERARGRVEVTLLTVQFPEDHSFVPEGFTPTPDLERSVLDLGAFREHRRLPLLKDILDRGYEAVEADYMIYTNVDIALRPEFYLEVQGLIEKGYDGFVINRRTIPDKYTSVEQLQEMYAEAGKPHPGHDCFVFKRSAYPRYKIGGVCVGVSLVGRVLLLNLFCHSGRFEEFKDLSLTFHIGDDRAWQSDRYADYAEHNRGEALAVLDGLEAEFGPLGGDKFLKPFIDDMRGVSPSGGISKLVRSIGRLVKP